MFDKEFGIEGNYEGIGHLILGFTVKETSEAVHRKENYIYWVR